MYVCREGETFGNRSLKEAIFEACEKRKNAQSEQIRVRMAGVYTDLHAADVRYHVDCKATFLSPKLIQAVIHQSSSSELRDAAFDSVIKYLAKNKASIHNSIHIYTQYMEEGDCMLPRRQLIAKIVEKFGGDMIALSSPGVVSILVFKSSASKALHIMPDDTDDQMNEAIKKVAKQIKTEIINIEVDRKNYYSHIDRDICSVFQSPLMIYCQK